MTVRFGGVRTEAAKEEGGVEENEMSRPRPQRPKIVTKTFDAAELAEKTSLYRRELREFSQEIA